MRSAVCVRLCQPILLPTYARTRVGVDNREPWHNLTQALHPVGWQTR
jgi:hypothetical protein